MYHVHHTVQIVSASYLIALSPGVLQLAVACYALRLIPLIKAKRSAWLLFSAFALLALVHLLLSDRKSVV